MSDAAHRRWQAIVERETLGEALSAEERRFRADFEAEHPECAAETAAWGALLDALASGESEGTGDDAADEALAARILAAARAPRRAGAGAGATTASASAAGRAGATTAAVTGSRGPALASVHPLAPRGGRRVAAITGGIAAIAAAAASLALLWRGGPEPETTLDERVAASDGAPAPKPTRAPDPDTASPPAAAAPEVIVVAMAEAGGLVIDGAPRSAGVSLTEGAELRSEGASCLLFREPFAAVCLGAGSEARVAAARGGARELVLGRGRLVATLDPMGPGQSFTVTTAAGGARAIGTIFAVAVDGPAIDVGVVEGKIEVRGAGAGRAHRLVAGQRATMADPTTTAPLSGDLDTWSRGQAALAALWRDVVDPAATPALLALDGAPGVAVTIDGVALPDRAAVELLIGAGDHEVSARGARGEPRTRTIVGDPGAPARLARGELLARAASGRPRPAAPTGASSAGATAEATPPGPAPEATPTSAELRRQATQARGERRWRDAADAYRALLDAHPEAPEADNARYQLAELLRARLGRPDEALALFDAYLARGGPLAAEARVGKIRCLQALGRGADEAAAIAEYLAAHPDHIEVAKFRQRAGELAER